MLAENCPYLLLTETSPTQTTSNESLSTVKVSVKDPQMQAVPASFLL